MISVTGEYALRAMVVLTRDKDARPVSAERIAKATGIPQKYLSATLGHLVRAGLVDGIRGKGGGFRLARPATRIHLAEIVAPFEPLSLGRQTCPFGNVACSDVDPCAAHDRWKGVKMALRKFLDETTLHEVAARQVDSNPAKSRRGRK